MVSKENKKLIFEGLGVFALCYVGGWSVEWSMDGQASVTAVALAHGFVLGLFVYLGASISGGHLNPAVTIALCITGYHKLEDGIKYVLAQMGGSIVAGVFLFILRPNFMLESQIDLLGHPSLPADVDTVIGFICEAIATGMLMLCVFSAGIHKKAPDAVVGSMVGASLAVGVLSIGNTTGAALNPARVFGPAILSGRVGERGHLIYYFGPVAGASVVALAYKHFFITGMPARRKEQTDDKMEQPYITG